MPSKQKHAGLQKIIRSPDICWRFSIVADSGKSRVPLEFHAEHTKQKTKPAACLFCLAVDSAYGTKNRQKTYDKQTSHSAISTHSYLCASPGRQTRVGFQLVNGLKLMFPSQTNHSSSNCYFRYIYSMVTLVKF